MTAITAYARARAVSSGRAASIATVRHVHLSEHPLVLVPLALAGEANAPLAAMVGTDRVRPTLLVVPQPRNRDLRFAFAARLADLLLSYVDGFTGESEEHAGHVRFVDAPQLLVPNRAGVRFLRLFGRSTRFRRTDGEYPVPSSVPLLGRWLTHFADRAELPGSSSLLPVTETLTLHWATGQSALEDANLATLMAWIEPPAGCTGAQAARRAEDPAVWPPAGPTTDPVFDNEVLAPAVDAYNALDREASADSRPEASVEASARRRALSAIEDALRGQVEPTWNLVWRAYDRLRDLPPGVSVESHWARDRGAFTGFHGYLGEEGPPQARRDGAVAAAGRLGRMEQAQANYDAERALDDPLVMADHRVAGAAFAGPVVEVDRERRIPGGQGGRLVTRPLVTVRTADPVHLPRGTKMLAASRRTQECTIIEIDRRPEDVLVTLEVQKGMGRGQVPAQGVVPEVGEMLCYTSVLPGNVRRPALPEAEETPWTHGGPPEPYEEPTDRDAEEAWE